MNANSDQSLIKKINVVIIPLFIVLILAIVGTFILQNNSLIKKNVKQDSKNKGVLFTNLTNELQNRALESALFISNLEIVKDAYRNDNMEEAAENLKSKIKPVLDEIMIENELNEFKVHFHLPGAKSFLRVWTNKRFDDLSGFRSTVLEVEKNQKAIKAIELGKGGFAIRGIAPIFDGENYLGSVEMFYNPYDVIKSMPKAGGNAGAFFLVNANLAKSLFLESQLKENFPQETEGFLISKINEEWINPGKILNSNKIKATINNRQINVDMVGNMGVAYIPVSDFSGKDIGIIIYVKDQTEAVQAGMNSMLIISGISVVLILVILFIQIGVIRSRITKPVKEFAQNLDELAKGNIDIKLPENYNRNAVNDELAIMDGAFERMITSLSTMISEVNVLTDSISEGKLDKRADSSDFSGAYKDLIVGANKLSDAFIGPINVTAEYVDRISKGDIPPKITDDYKGDFNEIKNNLNQAIDVMNGLMKETKTMINAVQQGKLDQRCEPLLFTGDWSNLIQGVNDLTDAFVGPINVTAEYVDRISKGDIPPRIIDEYKGDFNEIKNNLNQCVDVMNSLLNDIDVQINNVHEGKLDSRANHSKYTGSWSKLVQGINGLNDAFTAPLNVTAEYVDRISKGDLPPKIVDDYKGDFNEIKSNLNLCIDSIQNLINDANSLSDHVMHARLRERADLTKHNGDYRRIIAGINNTLDQFVELLDNIDAPIMGIDNEYNVVFINELGAKLDAKSGKELEGVKCFNHFKTSDCNTENCACRRAMVDIKKSASETDAHPGNFDLEIKYSGFPIKDEKGNVLGAFEIVLDQTEVKNAMKTAEKVSNFQKVESERITNALQNISKGNIDINYTCHVDDKDLKEASENFQAIALALTKTSHAIQQLTSDAEKLAHEAAEGNLRYRADDNIHSGEYRKIIKGVNETLDNVIKPLNETAEILKIMSTGNLTKKIESDYKGDFIKLKESVNILGTSLSDLINQVNETVYTTSSSAMEISSTAESLAAASQEQSAQADEVASAVEEMSRTITENAMSANKTSEMAKENSDAATEGGKVVQQTVTKMRDIAKVVENSATNIQQLGESSKQIGEIISVIDDIADQTNLLALNAAIEAARAGEQGRGFAVVADEVRKLAERTTDATKQIANMIKGIQVDTEKAVVAMNQGNVEVQSGIELADRAGESLESILTSTRDVLDMINQIAAASEEQSATSEQISKNVVSISKVTADSTRRIEDVAHTSEDLARLTEHLSQLMGKFKVDKNKNNYQLDDTGNGKQLQSNYQY